MLGYAVPPLETAGTVVLMFSTDTIASLVALAFGLSSSEGTDTGLSSLGGTGTGLSSLDSASSGLSSSEMVGKLVI